MIIVLIIILLLVLNESHKKAEYQESDYYQQTKNSYQSIRREKGLNGEYNTWQCLHNVNGYKRFIFNCYIPKPDGTTTEVDVIMLHESGIYVMESKNYSGWIFGDEAQRYWTQTLPDSFGKTVKSKFYNPVMQNQSHIRHLNRYSNIDSSLFYSYIVFSNYCELKKLTLTSSQCHVIQQRDLLSDVETNSYVRGIRLSREQIDEYYHIFSERTHIDQTTKNAHVENVNTVKEQAALSCPRCGGKLVLRRAQNGKYAGNQFYGCSNYPRCKFIKNITR